MGRVQSEPIVAMTCLLVTSIPKKMLLRATNYLSRLGEIGRAVALPPREASSREGGEHTAATSKALLDIQENMNFTRGSDG